MDGSTANLLRRFLQRAPDALTDEELLTLLLHAGTGAEEPRTLAARLIGQFGSLGAALSASPEELASVEGMDASRALLLRLVTELHRRYYLSRPFSGARLTGTTDFGNFLLPFFYGAREELVYLLALDAEKPVVLCVNKVDSPGLPPPEIYEFYNLGLGDPMPVSALHGMGSGDLLDACYNYFPPEEDEEEQGDVIRVAVIGKPNAGKSSLINFLAGEERVIVSDVAGTTRDSVDTLVENEQGRFLFIDTAGIRRKSRVEESIEKYSVLRALMAIDRSDVCLIMIDALDGVTEQDTKIAGYAHEKGKASIIVVNKWDLVEKDDRTMDRMRDDVRRDLAYMTYAPVAFISAKTGQRVEKLFDTICHVAEQSAMRITTGMLNNVLAEATMRVQPPTDKGRRLKIYYMTQVGAKPPCFVCFCNDARLFHFSYQRYLENKLRETFGLEGTPVRLVVRQKGDKD